jgi:hypothetical protein
VLSKADLDAWVARAIPRIDLLQVPPVAGTTMHTVVLRAPRADREPGRYAFVYRPDGGLGAGESAADAIVAAEMPLRIKIELRRPTVKVVVPVLAFRYRVAVDLQSRRNPPRIGGIAVTIGDARDPDGLVIKEVEVAVPRNVYDEIEQHAKLNNLDLKEVLGGSICFILEPLEPPGEVAQNLYINGFACYPQWKRAANSEQANYGIQIEAYPTIQFEITGSTE